MRVRGFALLCCALLAGCGSEGGGAKEPAIGKARTFSLAGLDAVDGARAGTPTSLRMRIDQPEGGPLTRYKSGNGPHTGVHLIMVNDALTEIVHRHPPVGEDGTFEQEVAFPSGGTWRVVADAYPDLGPNTLQNFQLTGDVDVAGRRAGGRTPGFDPVQTVNGATFTMRRPKNLVALRASFVEVDVRDARGRPARFSDYYGALAHAIFFREGDKAYFHTHVCGAGAAACTASAGGSSVSGTADRPGRLKVGMLLPRAGTWRLFLQARVDGKVTTVPYTLTVRG